MASPAVNPGARAEDRHEALASSTQLGVASPHRPTLTVLGTQQDSVKQLTARSEKLRAESKALQQSYQQRLDRLEALLSSQRSAASPSASLDGVLARHTPEARFPATRMAQTMPPTAFPVGAQPEDPLPPQPHSARNMEQQKQHQQHHSASMRPFTDRPQHTPQLISPNEQHQGHTMVPTRGPQHPEHRVRSMSMVSPAEQDPFQVPMALTGSHVVDPLNAMPSPVGTHIIDPRQRVASPVAMHRFRDEQDVRTLDSLAATQPLMR